MSDNVPITPGTGATIATDDVGGVQFQRVKLVDGTLDSSAAIPGTAANGLAVDVTRVQGSVATTVVDGGNTTIGAVADAIWSGSGNGTLVALLKAIWTRLRGGQATMANSLPVTLASDQTVPVSGTFWQATQPVSGFPAGFNLTGSDGIASLSATVKAHNGRNLIYVRDPAVLGALSEVTAAIHELTEALRSD